MIHHKLLQPSHANKECQSYPISHRSTCGLLVEHQTLHLHATPNYPNTPHGKHPIPFNLQFGTFFPFFFKFGKNVRPTFTPSLLSIVCLDSYSSHDILFNVLYDINNWSTPSFKNYTIESFTHVIIYYFMFKNIIKKMNTNL